MNHRLPTRPHTLICTAAAFLAAAPLLAGGTTQAAEWGPVTQRDGVAYIPLDSLRSFYKFSPIPAANGQLAISNGGYPIVFTPGTTRVSFGGYECRLVHPAVRQDNGDLLISRVDAVKLFDPVLRPTYITPRRVFRTVIIDPGHGGADEGVSANQIKEAEVARQIAVSLQAILAKRGYKVLLTREQDRSVSDQRRIEPVQSADAPIYISIHVNSGRSDIQGIETYCMQPAEPDKPMRPGNVCDAENIALAFCLHTSLISASGAADGACRRARYSLLSSVSCPAAMVEVGYATNAEEAAKLATPEYRDKLALAMADGITTFAKALNPDATIPSTTAPIDTTTPPAPYQADAPAKPAQQADSSANKGKTTKGKTSANAASKGKTTKGKTTKGKTTKGR